MPVRTCLYFLLLAVASPLLALSPPDSAIQPAVPVLPQGTINAGIETAGSTTQAEFSGLAPLYSTLGKSGMLEGTLVFAEPFVDWIERGAVDAGLGFGVRHLFGAQPVSQLKDEDSAPPPGFLDEGWFIGATLFGDMLERSDGVRYWQMTPGLEIGTRYLELRGHYQIPLTDGETTYERRSHFYRNHIESSFFGTPTITDSTASVHTKTALLHESLHGGDLEAAVLIPWLDRFTELKVTGGYASYHSTSLDSIKYDSGKAGLEWRPVPACVLSATWYSNERLVSDHWMYGVRLELPFETADIGDGQGGFWGHIKAAFKPRRRHLSERLTESAHAHQIQPQIAIYPTKTTTTIHERYRDALILPDGTVVSYNGEFSERIITTPYSTTVTTTVPGGISFGGRTTFSTTSQTNFGSAVIGAGDYYAGFSAVIINVAPAPAPAPGTGTVPPGGPVSPAPGRGH